MSLAASTDALQAVERLYLQVKNEKDTINDTGNAIPSIQLRVIEHRAQVPLYRKILARYHPVSIFCVTSFSKADIHV